MRAAIGHLEATHLTGAERTSPAPMIPGSTLEKANARAQRIEHRRDRTRAVWEGAGGGMLQAVAKTFKK
jgi:hypothetical protein